MVHRFGRKRHARLTVPESFRTECGRVCFAGDLGSARLPPPMSPRDPLQENRFMRTKLIIAIGLSIALATGLAIAKPRNGALGVYLDAGGNVVGTFSVSCDGVFGYSGTRTSHPVTNGQLL